MLALALAASLACLQPPDPNVTPTLIAESTGIAPGGTAWVAVRFSIREGWHIYWNGLNDSGEPPKVTFQTPAGVSVGDLLWPAPQRHVSPGDILDHVYERETVLMAPVTAPPDAKVGSTITLNADLTWLVCKDVCIPESARVTLALPVVSPERVKPSPDAGVFRSYRSMIPTPLPSDIKVEISGSVARIVAAGAASMEFYPDDRSVPLVDPIREGSVKGGIMVLRLGEPTDDRKGLPRRLSGVLQVRANEQSRPAYHWVQKEIETGP